MIKLFTIAFLAGFLLISVNGNASFLISLKTGENFYDIKFCSGALIAPGWIVTSALCVYGFLPSELKVVHMNQTKVNEEDASDCGKLLYQPPPLKNGKDLSKTQKQKYEKYNQMIQKKCEKSGLLNPAAKTMFDESDEIEYHVSLISIHPEYNQFNNNIALLKLTETETYGKPIKIDNESNSKIGDDVLITFWKTIKDSNKSLLDNNLVTIVESSHCQSPNVEHFNITNYMCLQADGEFNQQNILDKIGAPVIQNDTLIGLLSYGNVNGTIPEYFLALSLSPYADWIKEELKYCDSFLVSVTNWMSSLTKYISSLLP